MLQSAARKLYARCASAVINNFYVVHSDTFTHKTGAERLADRFLCGISCGIMLGFPVKILGGVAIFDLRFRKALIDKRLIAVFYFLYKP